MLREPSALLCRARIRFRFDYVARQKIGGTIL